MNAITLVISIFALAIGIAAVVWALSESKVDMSDADEHFRHVIAVKAAEQLSVGDAVYNTLDGFRKANASLFPSQGEIGWVTSVYENGVSVFQGTEGIDFPYKPRHSIYENDPSSIWSREVREQIFPPERCTYCGSKSPKDSRGNCSACGAPR